MEVGGPEGGVSENAAAVYVCLSSPWTGGQAARSGNKGVGVIVVVKIYYQNTLTFTKDNLGKMREK